MRQRIRSTPDPQVLAHLADCASCQETFDVAAWMQKLAELPLDGPALPTAPYLRWRAQILRRWDVDQRAVAPMDVGERAQVGVVLIGAVILLVSLWRELDPLTASSGVSASLSAVMIISAMFLAAASAAAVRTMIVRK